MIEKHHNRQRRNAKHVGTAWQTIRKRGRGWRDSTPEPPRPPTLRDHRQEGLRLRDQFLRLVDAPMVAEHTLVPESTLGVACG